MPCPAHIRAIEAPSARLRSHSEFCVLNSEFSFLPIRTRAHSPHLSSPSNRSVDSGEVLRPIGIAQGRIWGDFGGTTGALWRRFFLASRLNHHHNPRRLLTLQKTTSRHPILHFSFSPNPFIA